MRRVQDWRAQTHKWWSEYRSSFGVVTSDLVRAEFDLAPPDKARHGATFFSDVVVLEEPPGLEELIRHYIRQKVMPDDALGDAAHLAVASLHGVDFILSWNCRHLANVNKRRHIEVVNKRLGLPVPMIATPFELLPGEP